MFYGCVLFSACLSLGDEGLHRGGVKRCIAGWLAGGGLEAKFESLLEILQQCRSM